MVRHWRSLLVLLLPLALAGCAQVQRALPGVAYHTTFEGRFVDQLSAPDPEAPAEDGAETRALSGDAAKISLLEIEGVVRAPAFEAYLERVLTDALTAYPYELRPMDIVIEASDRASAWATPDGRLFVTLGLLENLESEGQLATALAHEAAHVQLGHFTRQDYFDSQRTLVTVGAGLAMIGLAASNLRLQETGGGKQLVDADPVETQTKVAQSAAIAWLVNGISDQVVNSHWTRRQEQQADLFAADLIIDAGHDPRAPADLFQLLGQLWGEEATFAEFLEAEQKRVGEELLALGHPVAIFDAAPAKILEIGASAAREAWRRFGFTHIDPDERRSAMLEYVRREYPGQRFKAAEREADGRRYQDALRTRLPEAVRAGHRAVHEAHRLLAEGDVAGAENKARLAIGGPTAGSAHTRTVMYLIRKGQGRHDDALANLERIAPDEFRPRRVFEFQAAEYLRLGRHSDALRVLDDGARQFGTEEPFWPLRIEVQLAMDDVEGAWETHAACRAAASGAVRDACNGAIEGAPQVAEAGTFGLPGGLEQVKGFIGGFLPAGSEPD